MELKRYGGLAALIFCLMVSACLNFKPEPENPKFKDVEKLWATVPIYPGMVEFNHSSSAGRLPFVDKTYKSDAPYDDVKSFYMKKLSEQGWLLMREKKMSDWGHDNGGSLLEFHRDEYEVSIQYAGATADKEWNYGITLGLYDK